MASATQEQQDLVRITIEQGTNLIPPCREQEQQQQQIDSPCNAFQQGVYLSIKLYDASLGTAHNEELYCQFKTSAVTEYPSSKWIFEQECFFSLDPTVEDYMIEIEVYQLPSNGDSNKSTLIGFGKQKLEPFSERITIVISSIWNSSLTCNIDYILDKSFVALFFATFRS